VDEGGRNEDTGAEVSRQEEELMGYWDPREAFDDYRKATCWSKSVAHPAGMTRPHYLLCST